MASVQERSDLHPVARESRLRPRQGSPAVPTLGLGHGTTGTPTSERGATLVAHVYFVNMTRESIRGCPRESAGGSVHHQLDPCHGRARHPNQPVKLWLHTASCAVQGLGFNVNTVNLEVRASVKAQNQVLIQQVLKRCERC